MMNKKIEELEERAVKLYEKIMNKIEQRIKEEFVLWQELNEVKEEIKKLKKQKDVL